jgi:parallel beta-helix repeat protein
MKTRLGRAIWTPVAASLVGLALFLMPGALAAASTTLYVANSDPSCSNTGPGTAAQPFCTISAAAANAVAGNAVQVAAGTYNEPVSPANSGTASAPIVYTAAPGASVTVGSGQADGFLVSGKSWITVNGFNITGTTSYGIDVASAASHVTISNNHVSYSGKPASGKTKFGIRVSGSTDVTISKNIVDHNTDSGIAVIASSARVQVLSNQTYANARGYTRAAAGIRIYQSTDNTVAGNLSHDNEDSGIESYPGAKNTLIYNNVSYRNGDHGIDNLGTTNQRIISNSVYKNVTAGINIEGSSTGAIVVNNISVDNGINSPRTHSDIRIESGSTSGAVVDSNVVWLNANDTLYVWNSTSYTTLSAFRAASGQGAHDIWADPKWAGAAGGNFHLTAGSPAIDSADSGVSGQPSADVEGTPRVDDPLTPNTGLGPRSYDDRGAYEYAGTAPDHIVISPATASIAAGASQTYTAQAFDVSGNSVDATGSTVFTIAPDGSCNGNVCRATTAGPHTVTGNDAGLTSTASLTVTAAPLDHLLITPSSATINAGGSQGYTADGRDQYNNSLGDVTVTTTFTIGPNGSCTGAICTASLSGAHTVTGTKSGKTGTATLQVSAGPIDHIVLSPASATIAAGGSQGYTAQGFDSVGNPVGDVTAFTTFSISPNGTCVGATCTATTAGAHTVTGNDGGMTSTAALTVNPGPLDHLALTPATATVAAGTGQAYTAQGRDQYDNSLGDVTAFTTFSITPNGSCTGATCTATTAGTHTVTGTNAGKAGTASLTVTAAALDHLVLSPASATISSGGSQAYAAEGRDQYDNSLGDVTGSTTFSITPNGSCAGATCTATASGAHTVTGTSAGKTGTASLQVNPAVVDHIVISPATATVSAGGSQAYTAEGFDASNNSLGDVTAFTTFSIAPEGLCTGSACTANAGGPHTVTGNDGGKTNTASLTVSFVKNPGFETDLTGWNTGGSGSGITLTRVSGGRSGSWAAQLTNTGPTTTTCVLNDSPNWVATTTATPYTGSLWVKADTAGKTLKLRFREYNSGTLVNTVTTQSTLTTTWSQVTVTHTPAAGNTLDFNAYLSSADAPPGTCFYADDAAITNG